MATFIDNATETEQIQEVGNFISKLQSKGKENVDNSFSEEINKLSGKQSESLNKFIDQAPLVISEASEKEVDNFVFVFLSVAKKNPELLKQMVPKLVQVISSKPEEKSTLKIRNLSNIYNIVPTSEKYQLYLDILKFAHASKNSDLILNQLSESDIDSKVTEWKLDQQQKQNFFRQIRDILVSNKSSKGFNWSVKFLTSYDVDKLTDEKEALEEAEKVALEAIRLDDLYQFDYLLDLPIIKKLENHSDIKYKSTYQLLKIFVGENLESYKTFIQTNPTYLTSTGLNADDIMRKIRLLSLASLGSANPEVSYTDIAKTLGIDENEVELWVIEAISMNLIAAKMDQSKRIVVFTRSLQRVFGRDQWKQISESLNIWRGNVKLMMNTLQDTKKSNPNQQHAALAKALQQSQI